MFQKVFLLSFCFSLLASATSSAVNPQDWYKKTRQRSARRSGAKQTMVAAVRGVDEPSQVDPDARNFEGVEKMEKKSFAPEKIAQFMAEGKLSGAKAAGVKP